MIGSENAILKLIELDYFYQGKERISNMLMKTCVVHFRVLPEKARLAAREEEKQEKMWLLFPRVVPSPPPASSNPQKTTNIHKSDEATLHHSRGHCSHISAGSLFHSTLLLSFSLSLWSLL